jgi:hypothetical protein
MPWQSAEKAAQARRLRDPVSNEAIRLIDFAPGDGFAHEKS